VTSGCRSAAAAGATFPADGDDMDRGDTGRHGERLLRAGEPEQGLGGSRGDGRQGDPGERGSSYGRQRQPPATTSSGRRAHLA
jgi:hypothetical protein